MQSFVRSSSLEKLQTKQAQCSEQIQKIVPDSVRLRLIPTEEETVSGVL